jgi:ABC-type Fe3+-hydroxamate transport system substrate-binding protein
MRVVCLVPSATEIVALLGAQGMLVGRSHECDVPARDLAHVPALTRSAIPTNAEPGEIDRAVRAQTAAGGSLYHLDIERLTDLAPDVILTQDLCSVCSVDLASVRRAAEALGARTGREPVVVSLNPTTLEGVLDDVLRIGGVLGVPERARGVVVGLRERLFAAEEYVPSFAPGPVVGFLEWTDPLYVAGHWTVQLIERAGGLHPWNPTVPKEDAGAAIGPQRAERRAGHSIAVPREVFEAVRPDWVIVCPCGVDLAGSVRAAEQLRGQAWFAGLPAARSGRVVAVDGNQMFNRPGPRLVEAFEWLVGLLHGVEGVMPRDFPWLRVGGGS